jgi:hypothetical protein
MLVLLITWAQAATGPVLVPDAAVMKLDEIGGYEVGYAYRGKPEQQFPLGWTTGSFDEKTGVASHSDGKINGKNAWLLHCPWINGTGISFQQFTFKLPKARRITLGGFTAMRAESIGKSDGATFRVYIDGKKLLDVNRTDEAWKPFSLDLTSFAGHTVVIRFETDPGPKDNPGWDYSEWGDRQLVLDGYHPKPIIHPDPPALDLAKMTSRQGTVVPPSGFAGKTSVRIVGDAAVLRYSGPDGTLEYVWKRPKSVDSPFFGEIKLAARMTGDKPVELDLANGARVEWTGPVKLLDSVWIPRPGSITCVRDVEFGETSAILVVTARLAGKSLVLDVSCSQPKVKLLDAGGWVPMLRRIAVAAPYYSGQVSYLPSENLFVNAFLDWTASKASSLDGVRANYGALTDGTRNPLKERVVYTAAWHFAEALPSIPNPPSPYIGEVGGKIVLDVWGGTFQEIAGKLETLHGLGIDNCIVLIHNWQRSGYDNALPMHYPAQAGFGGDDAMKDLVTTAKRLGYLIALHENYVDYYPNFDAFDPNDISLGADGTPEKGWYNSGTKVQSFAEKPNSILKFASQQSTEIHNRYGTNSDYLDVHSAVAPWFHVDFRAGEQGAGMFGRVWDVHRELWALERKTHGGPVFGEGNSHWYWSGLLDGVEAQFGTGWGWAQGLTAPLAVDFDLLRIHPLQMNHGMGYYERWDPKIGYNRILPMVKLDQYRMQEIAYGHAGFLAATTWSVSPFAWLEHNLVTPVTERYATARVTGIRYQVNGKWVDGTKAAKAGVWDRVEVSYSNGLIVTANNSNKTMQVGGRALPKFGWLARGAGVTAGTTLRGGKLVDYAETKSSIFANARNALDWEIGSPLRIRPKVKDFAQTGAREFRASYIWAVNSVLAKDYMCFVHFIAKPETDHIDFQQDHPLATPTSQWKLARQVSDGPHTIKLPAELADGDYVWYIGLFSPGGERLLLAGEDDGSTRIRLGVLKVREAGKSVSFEPEVEHEPADDYRADLNDLAGAVDFGTVRTDSSVQLRREGAEWVLRAWPAERSTVVDFSSKRLPMPKSVAGIGEHGASLTPERVGDWWRLRLPGAKEYRWKAE